MANTNRDILMTVDVKNSKITGGGFNFYVTDKNTSNFFVRLVMSMSLNTLISSYVTLENATNYQLKLYIIKPDNNLVEINGTLMDEKNALFQFNLSDEQKDLIGEYKCEFHILSTLKDGSTDMITTEPFVYTVKPSILNSISEPVNAQGEPVILRFTNDGKLEVTIDGVTKRFNPIG